MKIQLKEKKRAFEYLDSDPGEGTVTGKKRKTEEDLRNEAAIRIAQEDLNNQAGQELVLHENTQDSFNNFPSPISSMDKEYSSDSAYSSDYDIEREAFELHGEGVNDKPPKDLKDDQLKDALISANDIANDKEFNDNDSDNIQFWVNRRNELSEEWSNRKHLGPSPVLHNDNDLLASQEQSVSQNDDSLSEKQSNSDSDPVSQLYTNEEDTDNNSSKPSNLDDFADPSQEPFDPFDPD